MLEHLCCCISLITIEDINSFWIVWSLKVGLIGWPETSVITTNFQCVTSQNSEDLRDKGLFSSASRQTLRSSQPPTQWVIWVISSSIMWQTHEVDQLPPFHSHVKDEWRHGFSSWSVFRQAKPPIYLYVYLGLSNRQSVIMKNWFQEILFWKMCNKLNSWKILEVFGIIHVHVWAKNGALFWQYGECLQRNNQTAYASLSL